MGIFLFKRPDVVEAHCSGEGHKVREIVQDRRRGAPGEDFRVDVFDDLANGEERGCRKDGDGVAEVNVSILGEDWGLSALDDVDEQGKTTPECPSNLYHFGFRLRCLDEEDIRTGFGEGVGPPECLVKTIVRPGVGPCDNKEVGARPGLDRDPNLPGGL